MAARVNFKFVIVLSAALLGFFVAGVLAYLFVIDKSGEDYVRMGDEAMVDQDYEEAAKMYGRAVGHERTNVDWLKKWLGALEKMTFEDRGGYARAFSQEYMQIVRQLARVQQDDLDAHVEYFDLLFAQLSGNDRPLAELLNTEVEQVLPLVGGPGGPGDVIRRYRGIAFVQVLSQTGELPEEEFERTEEDLRAAIAVDPTDGASVFALIAMLESELTEARRQDRLSAIDRLTAEIDSTLGALQEAAPDAPWTKTLTINREMAQINDALVAQVLDPATLNARLRDSFDGLRDELDDLHASLMATPAADAPAAVLDRFQILERLIDPEATWGRVRELLTAYRDQDPDNAVVMVRLALVLGEIGQIEEALTLLDEARALPPKPLSAEGLVQFGMQALAARYASDFQLRLATGPDADDSKRDSRLQAAKEARREYASLVPTDAPDLKLLDGMIAVAEERFTEAIADFASYNQATGSTNRRGLMLEARVAQRLNRLGTARDRLTQLTTLNANDPEPLVLLARIERSFNQPSNVSRAIDLCERALRANPKYVPAQELLRQLQIEAGITDADDPALNVIFESRRVARGNEEEPGDEAAAERILRQGLSDYDFNPQIVRELAGRMLNEERIEEARELVSEARTRHPNDDALVRVASLLESDTVEDAVITLIDESDVPEIQKLLTKQRVMRRGGRSSEADAFLDQAIALEPTNPEVLDLRFRRAVQARDLADAGAVVDLAKETNADGLDGVTFEARLAAAEGRREEAVRLFEEVTESGRADAAIFRFLAISQQGLGRIDEALESYTRALEIRPDDVTTLVQYITLLGAAGRQDEALEFARRSRGFGESSEDFMNAYLSLEANAGGAEGRRRAIQQRRRLATEDPSDRRNRAALAVLYIDDRQWLEARELIDGLRNEEDALELASLDARWYADQGRVRVDGEFQSGIELAQRQFVEYIIGLEDDELGVEAYLTLARFMIQRGQYGVAVRAINDARPLQDPAELRAEKLFGDLMLTLGRPADAEEAFRTIVDAGADDEAQNYRKRLIEMLLRQNKFAEAETQIQALGPDFEEDLTIMMQNADVLIGQGRRAEALALLNRAVSIHQNTPVAYAKRAQVLLTDKESLNDALDDLGTALEIQPNEWRTLRLRSSVYYQLGRVEDALADLRSTVRVNPTLDDVLLGLMIELVTLNRDGEALDVAIEVIDQRPTDTTLMITAGRVLSDRGYWGRAAVLYGRAWELSQDPQLAIRYIDSLVNAEPPRPDEAERVLRRVAELEADADSNSEILIAQALIEDARGRNARARSFLARAFEVTGDDTASKLNWIRNVVRLYQDGPEGTAVAFVRELRRTSEDPIARGWLGYASGRILIDNPDSVSDGASELEALADSDVPDDIRLLAFRTIGAAFYDAERFEEAESAWRSGLEAFPNDWEMTNNLAYVIGVNQEQPSDAIDLARRAVELAPGQSQAWDTLAFMLLALGEIDSAEDALDEGSRHVRSTSARVNITLNRARVALARGNCDVARSYVTQARTSSDTLPQLRDQFATDIDELTAQIEEGC